jgi:endonuclease/exonuclease/phosphatase family metal-dependent hydrolase
MPPFEEPSFSFSYDLGGEIRAVRTYRDTEPGRAIPRKAADRLLLATWNIANLGNPGQQRNENDHSLIAEMLSWFDLIAVQEVHDNLSGLRAVLSNLPEGYRALLTDRAGNQERMTFVYDSARVTPLELAGEIAIPPSEHRFIQLPGIVREFDGFDRNPYAGAFRCGGFRFTLVNVHLFFGSDATADVERRALETFAVGRWADLERNSPNAYTADVVALGDFNMPKAEAGDPIFDALTARGLMIPEHSSEIGSSIATDNRYDQIAFFPGRTRDDFVEMGIFDFDGALFADLWDDPSRSREDFNAFMRFHISDHRIMWAQFRS